MSHISHDILKLYHQRNVDELCKKNLIEKLDTEGNTILHIIAMNLDQDTLQKINQLIPSQLHGCINTKNNLGELPLHKALDSLNNMNSPNDSIVTFMIKILGADPNIPDNNNRIIVPIEDPLSPSSSLHNDILRLNNDVIQNILALSKLNGPDMKSLNQLSKTQDSINSDTLSDQLKNIFGKHGKHGKRSPTPLLLDSESVNKKSSISTYMGNDSSNKLEFIKSLIKLYRSKISDVETKQKEMFGGLADSDTFDNLFDESELQMHGGYKGQRKINAYSSDRDDFVVSNPNDMLSMLAMQDRPKVDEKTWAENNEINKEIVQKIKKQLDVDDETAKTIAAYLKVQVKKEITESDPGKADRAKLDKVKDIVEDKDALNKQYDEMKSNKLFEEIRKNREERQKRRSEMKEKPDRKSDRKSDDKSDDKSDTSDNQSTSEKPKKKRTTKKAEKEPEQSRISNARRKIASNGYLQSDEMIFSPDY